MKAITEYIGVPYTPQNTGNYYKVSSGDTLWGIARKFGISVNELKDANNLTSNTLSIGQQLKIKSTSVSASDEYVVSKGDTLYGIVSKFGVSLAKLKSANNLISNTLSIGQTLKIPQ